MLNRWVEGGLLSTLGTAGMGAIAFTALAQGLLTDRYVDTPHGGFVRTTKRPTFDDELVTQTVRERLRALDRIAQRRAQTLAQLALAPLRRCQPSSAIVCPRVGAPGDSFGAQIANNVARKRTVIPAAIAI